MSTQSSSEGNQNLFIVAIVALVIAAGVLLLLWLQTRNTLQDELTAATSAAETSDASIAGLEGEGTEIAVAATEAAEQAASNFDGLAGDATSAAEQAASDFAALFDSAASMESTLEYNVSSLVVAGTAQAIMSDREANRAATEAVGVQGTMQADYDALSLDATSDVVSGAMNATAAAEAQANADGTQVANFDALANAATSEFVSGAVNATQAAMVESTLEFNVSSLVVDGTAQAIVADRAANQAATESASTQVALQTDLDAQGSALATQEADYNSLSLDATSDVVSAAMNATSAADAQAALNAELDALSLDATQGVVSAAVSATEVAVTHAAVIEGIAVPATQVAARSTIAAELFAIDVENASEELARLRTERVNIEIDLTMQGGTATAQAEIIATQGANLASAEQMLATQGAALDFQSTQVAELKAGATTIPIPTPVPPVFELPPVDVIEVVSELGITPDQLVESEFMESVAIDLTGEDNVIDAQSFENSYGDFVVASAVAWGAGAEEDYCGFTFRRIDGDNYYTAEIDRFGEARFYLRINGEWILSEATVTDASYIDAGTANHLVLVGQDDTFTLFVNGEQVISMTDSSNPVGLVSVAAGTFEESDVSGCSFTDTQVWELSDAVTSSAGAIQPEHSEYDGMIAMRTDDGGYILGDPDASVTLVEFIDFRCPHCQNYLPTINEFIERHVRTGEARLEIRFFPTADREAFTHRLVECAAGDDPAQFWVAHYAMYELTIAGWTEASIDEFAAQMDVNTMELLECIETASQVFTDIELGRAAGVTGTPGVRIRIDGGELQTIGEYTGGAVPLEVLTEIVNQGQESA